MPRSRIIPVFVPHAGCPHQCVFCDQRQITGADAPITPQALTALLAEATACSGPGAELAFYGGSFTAVAPALQEALLAAAQPFLAGGQLGGIRCSTRPDALGPEALTRLRRWGVGTVELGCQSMDDAVLRASGRGHTAADTVQAVQRLRAGGFRVVTQMMTGLPGDTPAGALATARALAALAPDGARIYPTLVLPHTPLAAMYARGAYRPQTLDEAVDCCAALWEVFRAAGIPVLRVGLHDTSELAASALAGPYHPAFGELVLSRMFLRRAQALLGPARGAPQATLRVAPQRVSQMTGQHQANLRALEAEFSIGTLRVCPAALDPWEVTVEY